VCTVCEGLVNGKVLNVKYTTGTSISSVAGVAVVATSHSSSPALGTWRVRSRACSSGRNHVTCHVYRYKTQAIGYMLYIGPPNGPIQQPTANFQRPLAAGVWPMRVLWCYVL
jgi:hypothetical protein